MVKNSFEIGLCETSCEVNDHLDRGLTNEIIAHFAGEFGATTMRIWLRFHEFATCDSNDNVVLKEDRVIKLRAYLNALQAKGVRDFSLLSWSFLYPEDFACKDGWAVPDPVKESDKYVRFLKVQKKLYELIAERFPEIDYFEPTNEPDGGSGDFLHREGFVFGKTKEENESYIYSQDEIVKIVLDLSYFTNAGVKKYNANAKVLFPGFWNVESAPTYLTKVFMALQSGEYPSVGNEHSNKQEDFFEVMNFHPYSLITGEIDEGWLKTQMRLYDVMKKFGQADMPVWYTEAGWSDFAREKDKQLIGGRFLKLFEVVEEKLPFVKKIFLFRLCTLADRLETVGEDNFGLIYNVFDEKRSGEPKPVAITLAKHFNGEDYDVTRLYKFAKNKSI